MGNNYGDCRSITISKMLKSLDIDLTSAMCFGLGQGYDFRYWIEKDSKIPMIITLGRNLDCEENLINKLRLTMIKLGNKEKSAIENMNELDIVLKHKKYVFLNVDRFYLDYLKEKFNPYHFGNHSILVKGFDIVENRKEYIVYDALVDKLTQVSDIEIKLGRASKYTPFTPDYYGFYIEENTNSKEITFEDVKDSIVSNSYRFLHEEKRGIDAFKKFISELTSLGDSFLKNNDIRIYLKLQMNFISKYILEFEDTHSFYRKVYSEFLKEVDEKYKLNTLHSSIKDFNLLGNDWNKLGLKIIDKSIEDVSRVIVDIKSDLDGLCKNEESSVLSLLNNINDC